jgi:PAS domain S-box-containing protein
MDFQYRQLGEWRGRFYLQMVHQARQSPEMPVNNQDSDETCSIDSAGAVVTWQQRAESLFGYLPSEALGQCFYHFCDPAETYDGRFERVLSAAYRRGRVTSKHQFIGKDGSSFRGNMVVKPIWERGEFCGYTVSIEQLASANGAL